MSSTKAPSSVQKGPRIVKSFSVGKAHPYRKALGAQEKAMFGKGKKNSSSVSAPGSAARKPGKGNGHGQRKGNEMDKDDDDDMEAEDMDRKGSGFVDAKTSKKIMDLARRQQDEIEDELADVAAVRSGAAPKRPTKVAPSDDEEEDNNGPEYDDEAFDEDAGYDDDEFGAYEDGFTADVEMDESERRLIEKFLNPTGKQRNLADIIMDRIRAAEQTVNSEEIDQPDMEERKEEKEKPTMVQGPKGHMMHVPPGMNPKVVEVYAKVGLLLSRYRSGKLPKPFKIIPSFKNWDEIIYLTKPDSWTPHATYQATRIFVSNLKGNMAHRFFELVLLDRVRDDIAENKKLNVHLYMALKKALYKPAAFFKGILLPLLDSGTCTLRESAIIGSVISKVSIPVLHSSAALLKIAEMPYTGPASLFIRILLDKKYALPYRVLDSLVFHFLRFKSDKRQMPVLWHQSFLVFAQRYKDDMTPDQKDALLEVARVHFHPTVTPEIRRELASQTSRMEE